MSTTHSGPGSDGNWPSAEVAVMPKVTETPDGPQVHGIKGVRVRRGVNPFKLVAIDMDGTLLNREHDISPYTRRVLSQLLARGVHVIFATGRPFTDVYRVKRRLNLFAKAESIPTPGVQVVTPAVYSPSGRFPSTLSEDIFHQTPTSMAVPPLGRARSPDAEKVIPRCFAITSNGACVYNEANQRVYERCIDPRICQTLYSMFMDDPEVNVNVFRGVEEVERARNKDYVNPSDDGDDKAREEWISRYPSDLEAALYRHSRFTYKVVPDLEKTFATDHVNEVFFLCYNPEKTGQVEETINERMRQLKEELQLNETVRVAPSTTYCLDIIPEGVSKASALQFVLDQLGLTMGDCIAMGDGLNDVEMLSSVGKGCIMANANPRLMKRLPDLEVIGSNHEDGVAKKLAEVFGLDEMHDDPL